MSSREVEDAWALARSLRSPRAAPSVSLEAETSALLAQAVRARLGALSAADALAHRARAFGDAARHVCDGNVCALHSYARGASYTCAVSGSVHEASGVVYVCASSGLVHVCTSDRCDQCAYTMAGSVCRVTQRERSSVSVYTHGATRGHFETGDGAGVTSVVPASATNIDAVRVALRPGAGIIMGPEPVPEASRGLGGAYGGTQLSVRHFVAREEADEAAAVLDAPPVLAGHAVASSASASSSSSVRVHRAAAALNGDAIEAHFRHTYTGNMPSKRLQAERIVTALLVSERAHEARARRHAEPVQRARQAARTYLRECARSGARPCSTALYEIALRHWCLHQQHHQCTAPLHVFEPHVRDHYVRVCLATWSVVCRAAPAYNLAAKDRPNIHKHCVGVLYKLASGFDMDVRVDAGDFGENEQLARELSPSGGRIEVRVRFLARDEALARALPASEDLYRVLNECGVASRPGYMRTGQTTLRDCYRALVDAERDAMRAVLRRAATTRREAAVAVSEFLERVRALEFARVMGVAAPYEMLSLGRADAGSGTSSASVGAL